MVVDALGGEAREEELAETRAVRVVESAVARPIPERAVGLFDAQVQHPPALDDADVRRESRRGGELPHVGRRYVGSVGLAAVTPRALPALVTAVISGPVPSAVAELTTPQHSQTGA